MVVALAQERPLVVTLHDLPQPSDGPRNAARRGTAYRRMAQAAAAVVVASAHEERLLAACGADVACQVVPLPVPELRTAPAADASAPPRSVAVLGYLYPGKGHEAVVAALPALPDGVGLTAWGRPSDGHEDLVGALTAQARALGRPCTVTGYVAGRRAARAAAVGGAAGGPARAPVGVRVDQLLDRCRPAAAGAAQRLRGGAGRRGRRAASGSTTTCRPRWRRPGATPRPPGCPPDPPARPPWPTPRRCWLPVLARAAGCRL